MTERSPDFALPDAELRTAGAILVAASLASVLMMAHHPSGSSRDMATFVEQIVRIGALNHLVHGSLIALLALLLFGFAEFSRVFGADRPLVRVALVAYAIGTGADIGAASINGFAIGRLAAQYAGTDAAALEHLRQLMHLCWAMNQSLADIGEFARALAIALWSFALLRARTNFVLGAAGLVCGGGIVVALLSGRLALDVHGMMVVVLAASAWNVALGVQLVRGRLRVRRLGPTA
ncbi:hypothetical protein [Dokdonella sp.]|uniref:hypothetical protein n=1 Tax=Dokdonella sp. TaxID=2291710 RepID=UPI002F3F5DCF